MICYFLVKRQPFAIILLTFFHCFCFCLLFFYVILFYRFCSLFTYFPANSIWYYLYIINIFFPFCFFLYENFTGRNRRKCSLFCLTLIKIICTSPNHGFMVTGKEKFEKLRD
ncbi:CEI_1a_G0013230.mRNA.1.CDS.1 [Saccharomyces cerevisiae]|nr:EM14S01-3B_G0047590.mRNA.1.CDS.1 [Saccharomyces cerevisiae]CAI4372835.1 AMH_1a_G0013280.mRNA.1.CDS.1 [Saccharomyces cerevisiae]CAI4382593.1 CEI_1a_G0013230.mRNA.1.CDS.1 [Saccharomyces cerevisiae]CAI6589414.1 AMH_1a_G0013280.mRNA.1.CDS.1 [Saccharomyces cerevisiae]CAI7228248.1 CEI_1a_G0013230.mRNA.1.CDS.1 [Saccharomyces cerevisiae]